MSKTIFKSPNKQRTNSLNILGLKLSAARYALLNVDTRQEQHTRNWRPQLLVLYPNAPWLRNSTPQVLSEKQEKLMGFVSQLKAGKGLTLISECIEGSYVKQSAQVQVCFKCVVFKEGREKS